MSFCNFRNKFAKKTKRAVIIAALFLFPASPFEQALAETYKDVIEKARTLVLQREKNQAINLLLSSYQKEKKNILAQKEISVAFEQLASLFLNEKTQQLYESGLSMRQTDLNMALNQLNEALKMDPDNTEILLAAMRISIATNDCDSVIKKLSVKRDLEEIIESFRLIRAQALLCLGKFEDFLQIKTGLDSKKSDLALFWGTVLMEYYFRSSQFQKLKDLGVLQIKLNKNFPETDYWLWKTALEEGKEGVEKSQGTHEFAQRYINSCKSLSSRQQRDYSPEPNLCRRSIEAETFLKKNNNS